MPSRIPRSAATLVCVAACGWALLVVAAPLLSTRSAPAGGARLSAVAYVAGGMLCHQRAARSFHLAGAQLPVCARCTALYVAGAGGLLFGLARRRKVSNWRAVLVLASLAMIASVGLEWLGAWAGGNAWRALTALPAGWAAGALVAESLSFEGKL